MAIETEFFQLRHINKSEYFLLYCLKESSFYSSWAEFDILYIFGVYRSLNRVGLHSKITKDVYGMCALEKFGSRRDA